MSILTHWQTVYWANIWLKTLFNIVEARFDFFFLLWCLCWMMMFRWINKQPRIQKFWHFCSYYQDIYDWISQLNKPSDLWFIQTQQSMGVGGSGHLSIFTSLKHLMLLKWIFFRDSFLNLIKSDLEGGAPPPPPPPPPPQSYEAQNSPVQLGLNHWQWYMRYLSWGL